MLRLAIALSFLSGCLKSDCRVGTWRCVGDELQSCVAHGGGVYGPIDDPSYVDSSGPTWEDDAACGANRCISSDKPFCALDATRDPMCGLDGYACDGTTLVRCNDGYAMERTACLACDAATGGCKGAIDDVCASATDCAIGMVCENHTCVQPCDCPAAASCAVCVAVYEQSADPQLGVPPDQTCHAGRCRE